MRLAFALLAALGASAALAQTGSRNPPGPPGPPPGPPSYLPFAVITEGFDSLPPGSSICPTGWVCSNQSSPVGATGWFNGALAVFAPQAGAGYIAANFQNTTGANTIDNWLVTPQLNFGVGAQLSFWTRTVDPPVDFPDRLEVRLCVGPPATCSVPNTTNFPTVLGTVNPNLLTGAGACAPLPNTNAYPSPWCNYVITAGIPGSGTGRIAFRYFVPNGGPSGANSDYIGIDTFSFDEGLLPTDLQLALSPASVGPVLVGAPVTLTATVTNAGPENAAGVTATFTIPAGLTYVSNSCGATYSAPTLTWSIGALANGGSVNCTINLTAAAGGTHTVNGNATMTNVDTNNANNTASSQVQVIANADLGLSITGPATGVIGGNVNFTATVNNAGPANATGVVATFTIPPGFTYVSNSCGASFSSPTLTWTIGALANGGNVSCTITLTLNAASATLSGSVTGNENDPTPGNNAGTVTITGIPGARAVPSLDAIGLGILVLVVLGIGIAGLRGRRMV